MINLTQYNLMGIIYKQMTDNFGSLEIEDTCNQFIWQYSMAPLSYLYEIQLNQLNVMLSVGHNLNIEKHF